MMIQELKNYLWHWPKAVLASAWYGFPARRLIFVGVTGTKGKTTTAHLIFHLLRKNGVKAGLISTIGAYFGDEEIDTGLHVTSPDPRELQRLLRLAVDKGLTHVILEVTSSGLDQFRVWGIKFRVAVITNIYPDHLDYHGTMGKYMESKEKIIKQAETVVLPSSFAPVSSLALGVDPRYHFLDTLGQEPSLTSSSPPGQSEASVLSGSSSLSSKMTSSGQPVDVSLPAGLGSKFANFANLAGAKLKIVDFKEDAPITSMNMELAVAAVEALEIKSLKELKKLKLLKILNDFKGVKGRLEEVYKNKFSVVIDFAHTPESLAAALRELRPRAGKNGKLIAVFGCAGERDHGRRRMGQAAAEMADFFVITAEDPRSEKVEEISEEIAGWAVGAGAVEMTADEDTGRRIRRNRRTGGEKDGKDGKDKKVSFVRISDRQEAINYAISMAKQGDVVGCFGKGHEKSMAFEKKELPWSEYEAVEKALKYVSISHT